MRRIERTKTFRRDYQRAVAAPKHRDLENLLPAVLTLLATDTALPAKYADHALRGEWKDFRDCAIVEMKIWTVPKPVPNSRRNLKCSLFYGFAGKRLVDYDNERDKA